MMIMILHIYLYTLYVYTIALDIFDDFFFRFGFMYFESDILYIERDRDIYVLVSSYVNSHLLLKMKSVLRKFSNSRYNLANVYLHHVFFLKQWIECYDSLE